MTLTRPQRLALYDVYTRGPLTRGRGTFLRTPDPSEPALTYRQFRRAVYPGWDCIMLPWQGMWLGIEPDGYTHS